MNIKEFAESHGVNSNAVTNYISRHPEVFEGHINRNGYTSILDDFAFRELEKKYKPLNEIYDGIPYAEHDRIVNSLEKELIDQKDMFLAKLQELNEIINSQNKEIAALEGKTLLLEDKDKQLKEKDETIDYERNRADQERRRVEELQKELVTEQNKTWWDKLRGR